MPPRIPRRLLLRSISTISALLRLSLILPTVSADGHQYFYGHAHGTFSSVPGNFQDATLPTEFTINERQLPGGVTTLPLPLPTPIPIPTSLTPDEAPIPLLISPYFPPSPSSPISQSSFSSSFAFVISKTSASAQSSQSGNSTATTSSANVSSRLTPINFLPFIILTSFFIISLMAWCLHGWCTRRPKEKYVSVGIRKQKSAWFWRRTGRRTDRDELVCGPAYASFLGQDLEEFATVRKSERYKWPSSSVVDQGRPYPDNNHDDGDPFLSKSVPPEFASLPIQTVRSVPSADPTREPNAEKLFMSPVTTIGPMSPTSIALRELYEVVLRGEYDGPSAAGSEERTPPLGVGSGVMNANRSTSGRKRQVHVRQKSEELLDLGGRWRAGVLSKDGGSEQMPRNKLEVRNPSVGEGRLGLREKGFGIDEEDDYRYSPLPTPTRVIHQISVREPSRHKAVQNSQQFALSPSKDVLPAHPRQITSPPLENQIYFVPMPTIADLGVGLSPPLRARRGSIRPKSRVTNTRVQSRSRSRERLEERRQAPGKDMDDRHGLVTSPLRISGKMKNDDDHDTPGRRNGASKGKLVKAARQSNHVRKGGS